MANGELRVDAYLWREATHKTNLGPRGARIEKGTRVEILDKTAVKNNSKVRLLADAKIVGIHGVLAAGTVGHVTTGKIKTDGQDVLAQFAIEDPSINGCGRPIMNAWSPEETYEAELNAITGGLGSVNELIELCNSQETSVAKWKKIAQGCTGTQVVLGASLLGLGIAVSVATVGIATPIVLALGAAAATAGLGGGIAKGTMNHHLQNTTHRSLGAGKDVAVTASAPFAKSAIVSGVSSNAGAAAGAVATTAFSFAGAAAPLALGAKGLHDLSKVDPRMIWKYIDFSEIVEVLGRVKDKLEAEKVCAPRLEAKFNLVIAEVENTLRQIPMHKIG